jgi:hypothetical protein
MPMSPCNAWNTPTMIIITAANRMNPTAQPGVSCAALRDVDEYASSVICRSLLCSAAGHVGGP